MEQLLDFLSRIIIYLIAGFGYGGVFLAMVLESACIPLPSEVILPFAGFLLFQGKFTFWKITLVSALGNVIGGLLAFFAGKYGGRPFIVKYGKYFFINEYKLRKTEDFFAKYGELTVFLGRMLPIIRTFISLPAGIAGMNAVKMSVYTFIGSLPWCALLIWAGKELGENWQSMEIIFRHFHILLAILIAVIIIVVFTRNLGRRKKR